MRQHLLLTGVPCMDSLWRSADKSVQPVVDDSCDRHLGFWQPESQCLAQAAHS